ncbi:hypothetical protein AHF37_07433 [Paragonimus kellicotti]|nr:hypothetical protein AHF37_07433 [Paragonimus kellicotti]
MILCFDSHLRLQPTAENYVQLNPPKPYLRRPGLLTPELLKKNWETDEPHLGELEHRMRQWYNTVEMANNWHFVVPNTISTLKRFKQESRFSELVPGKTITVRPSTSMPTSSTRTKLEDGIELDDPRLQIRRSISAKTVRFSEGITARSEHVCSDEEDYYFPHNVTKQPTAIKEEKPIQSTDSGAQVEPIYEPTGLRGKLTVEMKKQFDRISPIICRTGYEYLSQ